MTARLVVLASGSGTNCEAVMAACADGVLEADVVAVVTNKERTARTAIRFPHNAALSANPIACNFDTSGSAAVALLAVLRWLCRFTLVIHATAPDTGLAPRIRNSWGNRFGKSSFRARYPSPNFR